MARYSEIVDRYLHPTASNGDEYMVTCLFHDDSRASMQFNVESGLYICFACGARGNFKTLKRALGIRRFEEEVISMTELRARIDTLLRPDSDVLPVLDESYLKRYAFPTDYWRNRGFKPSTIAAFDLGYDPIGDLYGPYVTIPLRDIRGGLLGVTKRYLARDVILRYHYPKGFHRSSNLFGSWLVEEDDSDLVVLTEGAVDAMKVWQAGYSALAVYGSSVSTSQVRILRRLGVGQVVLMFDNDKAGRECTSKALGWSTSVNRGLTKRRYHPETDLRRSFLVYRAKYGVGVPNDPGGMTAKQVRSVLQNCVRVP